MKNQATVKSMHSEIMIGLQSLKDAKKAGLIQSDRVDFRAMQQVYLKGVKMAHAPRQERLHKLKIITHTKAGVKTENFSHVAAFYEDGRVLSTSGDVYQAVKVGNMYIANVEYLKANADTLCIDCR
jgi:hypothetical protein